MSVLYNTTRITNSSLFKLLFGLIVLQASLYVDYLDCSQAESDIVVAGGVPWMMVDGDRAAVSWIQQTWRQLHDRLEACCVPRAKPDAHVRLSPHMSHVDEAGCSA